MHFYIRITHVEFLKLIDCILFLKRQVIKKYILDLLEMGNWILGLQKSFLRPEKKPDCHRQGEKASGTLCHSALGFQKEWQWRKVWQAPSAATVTFLWPAATIPGTFPSPSVAHPALPLNAPLIFERLSHNFLDVLPVCCALQWTPLTHRFNVLSMWDYLIS